MTFAVTETRQSAPQNLCYLLVNHAEAVQGAMTELQWRKLVDLAVHERVGALLFRKLRERCELDELPDEARAALSEQYLLNAAQNRIFSSELARIAEKFENRDVSCVLLKGAALAHSLYEEPALRPMNDIDLLIQPEELNSAINQMGSLGYEVLAASHLEHTAWLDQAANHHVHLRNILLGVSVELHWRLIGGKDDWRSPDSAWFWEQKRPLASVANLPFYELAPEACLLYLAAHAELQHGVSSSPLLWYYDIYLLLEKYANELDWELVIKKAVELNWAEALFQALDSVELFFGLELPVSQARGWIPRDGRAARYIEQKTRPRGSRTEETLRDLGTFQGLARLRVLLALLFPGAKYMRKRYQPKPSWLWPLYYPYRWADIGFDSILALVEHIRSKYEKFKR